MPHTYPHIPLAASPRFRGKSPQGLYGDVIEEMDWSVGEVLARAEEARAGRQHAGDVLQRQRAVVPGQPGPLRGRKGMTWEGGVREPFLARLPGRIPKGKVCSGLGGTIDVLPTVAKLCGAKLPANPLDGIDIWPLLTGQKNELEREAYLYFDNVHLQCARLGRYKLHVARYNSVAYGGNPVGGRVNVALKSPELYDVVSDVAESYDIAAEKPEIVKDIQARMERLIKTFPADIQQAWEETRKRPASTAAAGAVGRPK